jgi:hypothetical protein
LSLKDRAKGVNCLRQCESFNRLLRKSAASSLDESYESGESNFARPVLHEPQITQS